MSDAPPPAGTIQVPPHLVVDIVKLTRFLLDKVPAFATAHATATTPAEAFSIFKFDHGQSNPTYLIATGSGRSQRKFVLRRKPPGKLLPSAHQVDREFIILQGLKQAGFPVANPYVLCEDAEQVAASGVGTAFYIMAYVEGRIYKRPDMLDGADIRPFLAQRPAPADKPAAAAAAGSASSSAAAAAKATPKPRTGKRPGGRIVTPTDRFATYAAMNATLARLHAVDLVTTGLNKLAVGNAAPVLLPSTPFPSADVEAEFVLANRQRSYAARQLQRWAKQVRASPPASLKDSADVFDSLILALEERLPADTSIFAACLTHGDYRLDNLILHPREASVSAVLDWELAAIGHPVADLAYNCMPYLFPATSPVAPGLAGLNLSKLGIPSLGEYARAYARNAGLLGKLDHFNYYMGLSLFRIAAIAQGVYARSMQGNASNASAASFGKVAVDVANLALMVLHARTSILDAPVAPGASLASSTSTLSLYGLPFSEGFSALRAKVARFIDEEVAPLELLFEHQHKELAKQTGHPWVVPPVMEALKAKAKAAGLWNFFLPPNKDFPHPFGAKLSNLDYAPLCELTGWFPHLAPEVFNCSAPDTGNMEVLSLHGSPEQQQRWLKPLLEGEIRSAYAMTEPEVASSDATNIALSMETEGDEYVLNGRKWWTSGAMDPRCKVLIVMAKSGDDSMPVHKRHSMIIVPMEAKGITVHRHLEVFGYDDSPHGHAEISFVDVRVPKSNIILGEGRGFEIAQNRLGPGRIHHCMRLIGMSERAIECMLRRVKTRTTFGVPLANRGSILADIADMRIEVQSCRLLVLQTAALMDAVGNLKARQNIAMIKVAVPRMAVSVIDRAIQAHGGLGVCQDTPLPRLWSGARTLRLADGPDEVHKETIAKIELGRAKL